MFFIVNTILHFVAHRGVYNPLAVWRIGFLVIDSFFKKISHFTRWHRGLGVKNCSDVLFEWPRLFSLYHLLKGQRISGITVQATFLPGIWKLRVFLRKNPRYVLFLWNSNYTPEFRDGKKIFSGNLDRMTINLMWHPGFATLLSPYFLKAIENFTNLLSKIALQLLNLQ